VKLYHNHGNKFYRKGTKLCYEVTS